MGDWIPELIGAVQFIVRVEEDPTRMWAVLAIAVVLSIPIFHKVSELLGNPNASKLYGVIMVAVGGLVLVVSIAATNMYVIENVPADYQKWVMPAVIILISAIIITPFIWFVMKGSFVQALSTWLLTIVAAMAFVYVTNTAWDVITGEKTSFINASKRRDALQKAIDQ